MPNLRLIIKRLIIVVLFLKSSYCYCQDCRIESLPVQIYSFKNFGIITRLYDSLLQSSEQKSHILLVNSFFQIDKTEAYLISIDSGNRKAVATYLTADSVVTSERILLDLEDMKLIVKDNPVNDFLFSSCDNVVSSHNRSVLVVLNRPKGVWVEFESKDGYLASALKRNTNYDYLFKAFCLIKKKFGKTGMLNEIK